MTRLTKKRVIEELKKLKVSFDENAKFESLKILLAQNSNYAGVENGDVIPNESSKTSEANGEILTDHGIYVGLRIVNAQVVEILKDNGTAKHCKMSNGTTTWIPYIHD